MYTFQSLLKQDFGLNYSFFFLSTHSLTHDEDEKNYKFYIIFKVLWKTNNKTLFLYQMRLAYDYYFGFIWMKC
jgi:hypothetical protein